MVQGFPLQMTCNVCYDLCSQWSLAFYQWHSTSSVRLSKYAEPVFPCGSVPFYTKTVCFLYLVIRHAKFSGGHGGYRHSLLRSHISLCQQCFLSSWSLHDMDQQKNNATGSMPWPHGVYIFHCLPCPYVNGCYKSLSSFIPVNLTHDVVGFPPSENRDERNAPMETLAPAHPPAAEAASEDPAAGEEEESYMLGMQPMTQRPGTKVTMKRERTACRHSS